MISYMPNMSAAIKLQAHELKQMKAWESSHGTPQQVALRSRIILSALAGEDNVSIAEALGDTIFHREFPDNLYSCYLSGYPVPTSMAVLIS